MPFSVRPSEEVLSDLKLFEAELASWGLAGGAGRLALTRELFDKVDLAQTPAERSALEASAGLEDIVWARAEGVEFAEVYRALHPLRKDELAPMMEKVLAGPLHPGKEIAGQTAEARNTMFQLRLGAGLRRAGATVAFECPSDISVETPSGRLLIECKRPYRGQNIRANIERAREQLRKRLDASPSGTAGLVAISVSRVANPGSRLLAADSPAGLRVLIDEIMAIHCENSLDFDSLVDLRVIGVLYHLYTPALLKDPPLLTLSSQAVAFISGAATQTVWPVARTEDLKRLLEGALGG